MNLFKRKEDTVAPPDTGLLVIVLSATSDVLQNG